MNIKILWREIHSTATVHFHNFDWCVMTLKLLEGMQGLAKDWYLGFMNFVTALAYNFYLSLTAAFTQPGAHL